MNQQGWKALREEINNHTTRKQTLEKIAAIVARHPEWAEKEPELASLLKQVA